MENKSQYPLTLRKLRQSAHLRELSGGYLPRVNQFIKPYFVEEELTDPRAVPGLDPCRVETKDSIFSAVESDLKLGIKKILLFGVPKQKSDNPSEQTFTCEIIKNLKNTFGSDLFLAVDVCLCSYTTSGQCGILNHDCSAVLNHETVLKLAKMSCAYAAAGADAVAPSDMMDGRIAAIKRTLLEEKFEHVAIMSYSSKFHSAFYGPFRDAAQSAPQTNAKDLKIFDRSTYQIEPANIQDALRSSLRDQAEGADFLMVKPGLPYLDVIKLLSEQCHLPVLSYQVSGEYASLKILAREGMIDFERALLETWTSLIRAGSSGIISYGASLAPQLLR